MKQKLTKMMREIQFKNNRDFHTPLLIIVRTAKQKINKNVEDLNEEIDYKPNQPIEHSTQQQQTIRSSQGHMKHCPEQTIYWQ